MLLSIFYQHFDFIYSFVMVHKVEQFFDKEAEVSDDENDDDDDVENCSQFSVDSFIDDESNMKPSNITNYLKSLK